MSGETVNIIVNKTVREVNLEISPSLLKNVLISVEEVAGPRGLDAYEIAVSNGFQGSISEWEISLKGEKGDPSIVQIGDGERVSGVHAGTKSMLSMDDDYFYICIKTGDETNSVWKRIPLFKTGT